MDFFNHNRYRLIIICLSVFGGWPFQSRTEKLFMGISWGLIVGPSILSMVYIVFIDFQLQTIITLVPIHIYTYLCLSKLLNHYVRMDKIEKLLRNICKEWSFLKSGPEFDIMLKYADQGYEYTFWILTMYLNAIMVYITLPNRAKILEWLGLSNQPAKLEFPYPFYFPVIDMEKYFYYLEAHVMLTCIMVIMAIITLDSLFVVFIQHVCGLFAVVSYQLEHLSEIGSLEINLYPKKQIDREFRVLSDCIRRHNRAFEFVKILDDTFCWITLNTIGMEVLTMTFSGFWLMTHRDNVDEILRYGAFLLGQIFHVFIQSAFPQQLMDHSAQIAEAVIMCKWYSLSMRTRKLLIIISMRSEIVTRITAGRMFTLSLEFYCAVLKSTMSYFTLLNSVQEM